MENESYVESVKRASIVQSFFAQIYGWMFFGLLTTGIVAYYTAHSPFLLNLIFSSKITFYVFLFAPIILVMIISSKINSLSASMLFVFCLLGCHWYYAFGNFSCLYAGIHCHDFWDNCWYFWRYRSFWLCHQKRFK